MQKLILFILSFFILVSFKDDYKASYSKRKNFNSKSTSILIFENEEFKNRELESVFRIEIGNKSNKLSRTLHLVKANKQMFAETSMNYVFVEYSNNKMTKFYTVGFEKLSQDYKEIYDDCIGIVNGNFGAIDL